MWKPKVLTELQQEVLKKDWTEINRLACVGAEVEEWVQIFSDPENQPPQWTAEQAMAAIIEISAATKRNQRET